jgi:hypothetical protein
MGQKAYLESTSEKLLQETAIEALKVHHWLVHHCRPARNASGWSVPISGHTGFPDLVCARDGRVLFVECKTQVRKLTETQSVWRYHLQSDQVEYVLLRPSTLDAFLKLIV